MHTDIYQYIPIHTDITDTYQYLPILTNTKKALLYFWVKIILPFRFTLWFPMVLRLSD